MKKRQYYLDWIRVIAFGLLIFYHSGMFFVDWGWHVKNNVIANGFKIWMEVINPWRLSLLFFISGVGVSFAMKSRTSKQFIGERTKRLLLPLIFGMFVIVPPQIYFERLQSQAFEGSYWSFYPSVFAFVPYPEGSFSWHHLWFVAYLWVFSLLATPFFTWIKAKNLRFFSSDSNAFLRLILLIIPLAATYFLLRKSWPVTHNLTSDWYNFTLSLLFFINGYLLGREAKVWDTIEKNRKIFLFIAIFIILLSKTYDALFGALPENTWKILLLNSILKMTHIWFMILAIAGFAKHYLNFSNSFVSYANEAVYPFYILHQTITVSIGFYMADWPMSVIPKFFILVLGTFGGSFMIYHFLIKPFSLTRILFGLKNN
ncbi:MULTISPECIES: acyltransferase family protein [Emticicia]|uniref:acyltransferase family protein n=1 Tax=Emticicia TaxID=312278 RepID=UPI0007D8A26A|nr:MULTISPECIES: acyltransferase family protein [Emticicia]